jgi:hypothetical protein
VAEGGLVTVAQLLERWRADAQRFRAWGQLYLAVTVDHCIEELEQATHEQDLEQLTIPQAAIESGYSESQLRRRFPGRRTIARGDLPRKGTRELGPSLVRRRSA